MFDAQSVERSGEFRADAKCGDGERGEGAIEVGIRRADGDGISCKAGEGPGSADGGSDGDAGGEAERSKVGADAASEGGFGAKEVGHAADIEEESVGFGVMLQGVGIDTDDGGVARGPFGELAE